MARDTEKRFYTMLCPSFGRTEQIVLQLRKEFPGRRIGGKNVLLIAESHANDEQLVKRMQELELASVSDNARKYRKEIGMGPALVTVTEVPPRCSENLLSENTQF